MFPEKEKQVILFGMGMNKEWRKATENCTLGGKAVLQFSHILASREILIIRIGLK